MSKQSQTTKSSKSTKAAEPVAEVAKPAEPVAEKKAVKKASSKKEESVPVSVPVSVPASAADASASATAEESSTTRKRHQVTREEVDTAFDALIEMIDKEVEVMRSDEKIKKGVRFLRSVAKQVRKLKTDSARVSNKRVRRQTNRSTNSGFMKPVPISKEMQKFTGIDSKLVSRVEVTKAICTYVKDNNLQLQTDRRQFTPDEKLAKLLGTSAPLTYYDLQKYIQHHFVKAAPLA